ncbi:MAG TPA: Rab family GTPase [Nitrospirales bacterium]|nr:GTP-binding protein [Nitrospiraceae bacterium]HNP28550.1 Rab family GTPase [Nitrospirales bacterium]
MIQKKICLLGAFAVGKTSLVKRLVSGIFSDKYLTTVGVKIDQKKLSIRGQDLMMVIWDLYGDDDFQKVRASYLQGSSGYILVIDGTRKETVDVAGKLHELAQKTIGPVPFVLLLNKHDLVDEWVVECPMVSDLRDQACLVSMVSAKTGEGVEAAFTALSEAMLRS